MAPYALVVSVVGAVRQATLRAIREPSVQEKHPEALLAFQTELRLEKEKEERRRNTLEKYEHSAYIEQIERWPDSAQKDKYSEI